MTFVLALAAGCTDPGRLGGVPSRSDACPRGSALEIDRPEKIGIGAWEDGPPGWAADRIAALGAAWYYVWGPEPLAPGDGALPAEFVPMIWDGAQLLDGWAVPAALSEPSASAVLGFNEPDRPDQADMTVADAVRLWPRLMATGRRLGSPAPSTGDALRPKGWLAGFMAAAASSGLRVDFVAVHYYSPSHDLTAFRAYLESVYRRYGLPVWVTEWALVHPKTWTDKRARYSPEEAACFFRAGAAMLDELGFVERHAWFAAFDGGDGWNLNTHAVAANGSLTPVGRAFVEATGASPGGRVGQ